MRLKFLCCLDTTFFKVRIACTECFPAQKGQKKKKKMTSMKLQWLLCCADSKFVIERTASTECSFLWGAQKKPNKCMTSGEGESIFN